MTSPSNTADNKLRQNGFYFQKPTPDPALSSEANLIVAMAAVASRLVYEERTLCIHTDGRRENVAEHSFMLAKVAVELARQHYPDLDPGQVALAAISHDDLEAYVNDTPTHNITVEGLQSKAEREAQGLEQLACEYAAVAPDYVDDIYTYEKQEDPHVRFVRIVDKLMVLLIHIPNQGAVLREHFPTEIYMAHRNNVRQRLLKQYPEYSKLIQLEGEIAQWLADQYLSPRESVLQSDK